LKVFWKTKSKITSPSISDLGVLGAIQIQ